MPPEMENGDRRYAGPDRRGWHVDRTFNISHIVSVIVLLGTVVGYTGSVEKRVLVLEERLSELTKKFELNQESARELVKDIRDELRAIRLEAAKADKKQ